MSTRPEDLFKRVRSQLDEEDEEPEIIQARQKGIPSPSKLAICGLAGIVFGISIEKGRVFEPHIIREQMLFTNFTMLKMFLSASATGMLVFSVLMMIPATSRKMDQAIKEFFSCFSSKGVLAAGLGGAMLGCGMTLAGACPGMVLAQVGASVPDAILTMVGGLIGVYVYALTNPIVLKLFTPTRRYRYNSVDEYLGTPFFIIACPLAAMLGLAVFAFEVVFPWYTQVELSGSGVLGSRAWPPYVAGILIGLLQLPVVLTVEDTLGSGTSYTTLASQILIIRPLQSVFAYLKKYTSGVGNWWQVFYVFGAILGARISASASGTIGSVEGVGPWYSLTGGFLMLYGSRLAGGCTSGHGLSGMGLLALLSFVAVPTMFAGGISVAFLMKYGIGVKM